MLLNRAVAPISKAQYLNLNNRGSKIEHMYYLTTFTKRHFMTFYHLKLKESQPKHNYDKISSYHIYCYFSLSHLNTFDHITHYGKTGDRHGSHCKWRASWHDVLNLGLADCSEGGGCAMRRNAFSMWGLDITNHLIIIDRRA